MVVRTLESLCSDDGEAYVPMTVDPLLGNPEVALRQVGNGDPVITWAPTAADLYGRGSGTYLDLAGDGLQPGCVYATDSARYAPPADAAVYAHVATEKGRPGYLALQYFSYWYYNDWNDKHESDWEFIQVLFKADTVEEALAEDPLSVGYAQHTGGETAAWDSDKLEREGTRPVVYASENSHASYFAPALYLGRGASEGFGCDNTQGPSTRLDPRAVLLPDAASGPDDPFAWLAFTGRWGERQSGPNNGPDGPTLKPRWTAPVTWQEELRDDAFVIPGGSETPPTLIGTFCRVVETGSVIYVKLAAEPARVLFVLGLLLLVVLWLLRRTSWSRVPATPVLRRRRGGQIVRAAARTWAGRPLAFMVVGLLAVPVGLLASLISVALSWIPYLGEAVDVSTNRGDPVSRMLIASGVGTLLWPVTVLLVSAATAHVLGTSGGRRPARWDWRPGIDAVRETGRRLPLLVRAYGPIELAVVLLNLTVVGAPLAGWLVVRYQLMGPVAMLEQGSADDLRLRASGLVRHRWWHTAVFALGIWAGIHAIGVAIGLLVLVAATGLPLWAGSLVVMAVEVALTPLGGIALTLLYGDAAVEHDEPDAAGEPGPEPSPVSAGPSPAAP